MSSRRVGGVVLLLASGLALLAPPAGSATNATVSFGFGGGTVGEPIPTPLNRGVATDVATSIVKAEGGQAVTVRSRPGQGYAVRFPKVADSAAGRLAIVTAVDQDLDDGDALSPGNRNFALIADFKLNDRSQDDGGNNLVQRGLARSSEQYKLQVDVVNGAAVPSCAVGQTVDDTWVTAVASSPRPVSTGKWYQVRCRRTTSTLVLTVHTWTADGTLTTWSRRQLTGIPPFDLTWPATSPAVPLTIGGKLQPNGSFPRENDQFNGVVDNVTLRIE